MESAGTSEEPDAVGDGIGTGADACDVVRVGSDAMDGVGDDLGVEVGVNGRIKLENRHTFCFVMFPVVIQMLVFPDLAFRCSSSSWCLESVGKTCSSRNLPIRIKHPHVDIVDCLAAVLTIAMMCSPMLYNISNAIYVPDKKIRRQARRYQLRIWGVEAGEESSRAWIKTEVTVGRRSSSLFI